jgi:hypothetical protein
MTILQDSLLHGLPNKLYRHQIKMSFSTKKTYKKGTSRQVFIKVYRLEIQSVMMVFSTQLCKPLPLSSSLWFDSPPVSCVNRRISMGFEGRSLRQIYTCRKVPLQVNLLDADILQCLLWVLSFYGLLSSPRCLLWWQHHYEWILKNIPSPSARKKYRP